MKDRADAILRPAQAGYLDSLLSPPDDPQVQAIFADMEAVAERDEVPISDPEVGRLLTLLARALQPRRALEIGTAIGYGALCLAHGAKDAEIVTIDPDADRLEQARRYLERAGVAKRVTLVEGEALAVLDQIEGPFELAYIDAIKTEYRDYLDRLVPKLAIGGMAILDNLLWKGWVADPPPEAARDESTEALRSFNSYLVGHPQLDALVLPIGDGLGLATRMS